jgi:hypothetical protein
MDSPNGECGGMTRGLRDWGGVHRNILIEHKYLDRMGGDDLASGTVSASAPLAIVPKPAGWPCHDQGLF